MVAAAVVVLAAVSTSLINELHHGWPWWLAAGAVVLVSAGLAAWLALRSPPGKTGDRLGLGAVKAGRDIIGNVRTGVVARHQSETKPGMAGDDLGSGAVKADRDIRGDVRTDVIEQHKEPPES
jgi:cobalamin synthase